MQSTLSVAQAPSSKASACAPRGRENSLRRRGDPATTILRSLAETPDSASKLAALALPNDLLSSAVIASLHTEFDLVRRGSKSAPFAEPQACYPADSRVSVVDRLVAPLSVVCGNAKGDLFE